MQSQKATEILDAARRLMMDRGYNGFSFRDVAAEVGIKSASIHHHYPTKAELAEAAVRSYREACGNALTMLPETDAPAMLAAYGDLFVATLRDQGSVCLCGILAAEASTLPERITVEVGRFFEEQRSWLTDVVRKGKQDGDIKPEIDPDVFAETYISGLEGAMMIARGTGRPDHLARSIDQLIQLIRVG
ncbi:TetR/AcrR family transcriptional regulator [Methyloligella sp. 2.7D]|uniref:TetR/AcrR family transcriptional regulator n=1 Tax=unclassified Methyloligella TaxID=2625955 RepID=UPI00157CDC07|nr:TetR/AcrR family transcriptional regulator [Methyloligella sp. GL2]QKP77884.1 TetR/AcrR family transcriptional regulator [Methyloligella sp. GL2]